MMMMNSRDKETPSTSTAKQEVGECSNSKGSSSSSRQWSSVLKNPRIVRVSRTFGGKDRHSKVYTIKGLRDRRIRLSVPTAIQLYDLQDRLGLSQPSKVIDWLLDNTRHDIDKLPPLPIMPSTFSPFQYQPPTHNTTTYTHSQLQAPYGASPSSTTTPLFFDHATLLPSRKEDHHEENFIKYWDSNAMTITSSKQKGLDHHHHHHQLAQNLFPIATTTTATTTTTTTTLLSDNSTNSNNPMLNYYHWEPSNLSLAQLGSLGLPSQSGSSSSSLSLSTGSHLFLCPSMATSSLFTSPHHASLIMNPPLPPHHQVDNEHDLQQLSRFHLSNASPPLNFHNSNGLGLRPFPLSIMNHHPPHHLSRNDHENNLQDKASDHHGFPWKHSSGN